MEIYDIYMKKWGIQLNSKIVWGEKGILRVKSQQDTRGVWIWNVVCGAMQRLSYLCNQSSVTIRQSRPSNWLTWLSLYCVFLLNFFVSVCVFERKREGFIFITCNVTALFGGGGSFSFLIYESVKSFLHET